MNEIIRVTNIYNYSSAGGVFSTQGIAPAVMENHGEVTRIIIPNMNEIIKKVVADENGNKRVEFYRIDENGNEIKQRVRIRKLTPRECFRLMDVDDCDIDKIQQSGVSKSQQYKLAGNSIVVSCLYHIFRTLFVDTKCTKPIQQTLFD